MKISVMLVVNWNAENVALKLPCRQIEVPNTL